MELQTILIHDSLANYKAMFATKPDFTAVFIFAHIWTFCETRQFS